MMMRRKKTLSIIDNRNQKRVDQMIIMDSLKNGNANVKNHTADNLHSTTISELSMTT